MVFFSIYEEFCSTVLKQDRTWKIFEPLRRAATGISLIQRTTQRPHWLATNHQETVRWGPSRSETTVAASGPRPPASCGPAPGGAGAPRLLAFHRHWDGWIPIPRAPPTRQHPRTRPHACLHVAPPHHHPAHEPSPPRRAPPYPPLFPYRPERASAGPDWQRDEVAGHKFPSCALSFRPLIPAPSCSRAAAEHGATTPPPRRRRPPCRGGSAPLLLPGR